MNTDHVTYADQRFYGFVKRQPQLLFDIGGKPVPVGVVELDVERFHSFQDRQTDSAGGHHAHIHSLDVVGPGNGFGNVPTSPDDPTVLGKVVPDQRQHLHNGVFRDADAVAPGHFADGDVPVDGCLEVDVVRPDSGGYGQLEVDGFFNPLGREIRGPEGLGYDYVSVGQLSFENGIGAIFVRRYDEPMSPFDQKLLQPKSARNRSQQVARSEVYGGRRWQSLAVRIPG